MLEKISPYDNNPEKSSTIKLNKHTPCGFSLFNHCSFDTTKNKLYYYRGKDCMKVLCKILKEHVKRIIYKKKKEMIPLTDEENRSHENQKHCHVCRKLFKKDVKKVRDHCHFTGKNRGAARSKCNMNYEITRNVPIVSHNLFSNDWHLIIKELAAEFDGELECLGENTKKYISFSVKINKSITKKDEGGNEKIVNILYKLKFIDSYRFMSTSFSNLVDNLSNKLHNNKCLDCKSGLDYMIAKDDVLIFKCFECEKNYEIDFEDI